MEIEVMKALQRLRTRFLRGHIVPGCRCQWCQDSIQVLLDLETLEEGLATPKIAGAFPEVFPGQEPK